MNLTLIDWIVLVVILGFLIHQALLARRHMKSVADFLTGGRCAKRYLLSIADGAAAMGAITILALFELYYEGGFTPIWWSILGTVVYLAITLSGWVIYRFRQTRAMTMAQFFGIRYSKSFRIFAGFTSFISGILNFGLFPAVSAHFFIYYCGLPETVSLFGFTVGTFPLVVIILQVLSLFFTLVGGQLAVMITDFYQGLLCNIAIVVVVFVLLVYFKWPIVTQALSTAPENASLTDPFKTSNLETFNMWYFLIGAFGAIYGYMSWQGNQGYNCAAENPHEARMGKIMGNWRWISTCLILPLLPIAAYTFLHHPDFASDAQSVLAKLGSINNTVIEKRVLVPIVLNKLLPVGVSGLFCAAILAAFISANDTNFHSWGSIFLQDVVMPFKKKRFTNERHILYLRLSVLSVAIFTTLWAIWFKPTQNIFLYFAITGSIFSGAGAAIIGGLYWSRGTTAAAWTSMTCGSTLAVSGIVIKQIMPDFFINEQWMWLISMAASSVLYVVVSLFGSTKCNMDKLLHRGEYATVNNDIIEVVPLKGIRALFNMGSEFSRGDKVIYIGILGWAIAWSAIFIFGTIYWMTLGIDGQTWLKFWHSYVWLGVILGTLTMVWFIVGGFSNLRSMFRALAVMERDYEDDGTVGRDTLPKDGSNKEISV